MKSKNIQKYVYVGENLHSLHSLKNFESVSFIQKIN